MRRVHGVILGIPLVCVAVPAFAVDMPEKAAPPVDAIQGGLGVAFPIH